MLHSSTYCARKISRKQYSNVVPDGADDCVSNADELLRKASRKLSQLSGLSDFQQNNLLNTNRASTDSSTPPLNGSGAGDTAQVLLSSAGGIDSSSSASPADHPSDDDLLTVLDCSNLNLGQLPIELLTEHSEDIEHLILDENELDEQALEDIPRLDKLKTLSLNGNQIKNIGVFLQYLKRKCPNLKFLSLIGNPGWPHPILNNNLQLYRDYALSAVRLFPSLQFLDTARVSSSSFHSQPVPSSSISKLDKQHHHHTQQHNVTTASTSASSLATVANACRLF